MKVQILIDHPWKGSFNYAVMEAFIDGLHEKGHRIDLIDLNQDQFDPVFSADELAVYADGISLDPQVKDYQIRACVCRFPGDDLPDLVECDASPDEGLDG